MFGLRKVGMVRHIYADGSVLFEVHNVQGKVIASRFYDSHGNLLS